MLIEHRQYLALLDEIDFLKKDNELLRQQNLILTQQLYKEKEQSLHLEDHHQKNLQLIQQLHDKTLSSQSENTKSIIQTINHCNSATKTLLENKFQSLENATSDSTKENQILLAKNKLDFYELKDFTNKLKTIFKESQTSEANSNPKVTLPSVLKWVKGLAGVTSTQQKLGQTVNSSTNNLKKQGNGKRGSKMRDVSEMGLSRKQSQLRQNNDFFNGVNSKSKLTINDFQQSNKII